MNQILSQCPVCQHQLEVTKLYCRNCDTTIDGHFEIGNLHQLSADQLSFLITFVRNEGKINRVGEDLGISYPTVRSRLHDVIRSLGFEVGEEEEIPATMPDEERQSILESLSQGKLSSEEALKRLSGRS
ncbi:MAG TPA: DUF2089 domain-containing protein [Anaerolineae bacterium]|nr:DUF2089 domain-containing protein [Anaerolineae bacterium]